MYTNEMCAHNICAMIMDGTTFMARLVHIQQMYQRGLLTYKEVENIINDTFRCVANGYFNYILITENIDFDEDFDSEYMLNSVTEILTQGCLRGMF